MFYLAFSIKFFIALSNPYFQMLHFMYYKKCHYNDWNWTGVVALLNYKINHILLRLIIVRTSPYCDRFNRIIYRFHIYETDKDIPNFIIYCKKVDLIFPVRCFICLCSGMSNLSSAPKCLSSLLLCSRFSKLFRVMKMLLMMFFLCWFQFNLWFIVWISG